MQKDVAGNANTPAASNRDNGVQTLANAETTRGYAKVNELKRLARKQCATFDTATKNECLLQTGPNGCHVCKIFRGLPCTYFGTHVVPAQPRLNELYRRKYLGEDVAGHAGKCAECGAEFQRRSNAVKYCSNKCRAEGRKRSKRKYNRKKDKSKK